MVRRLQLPIDDLADQLKAQRLDCQLVQAWYAFCDSNPHLSRLHARHIDFKERQLMVGVRPGVSDHLRTIRRPVSKSRAK